MFKESGISNFCLNIINVPIIFIYLSEHLFWNKFKISKNNINWNRILL